MINIDQNIHMYFIPVDYNSEESGLNKEIYITTDR